MKKHTLILLTIAVASGLPLHANDSTNRDHILAEARAGRAAAVESSLEALAAATPADAEALSELGGLRLRQGRAKDAVELLQKAAELAPNRAEVQSRLGSALSARMPDLSFMHRAMTAGRMLDAFKRSVELDPDHLPGRIGLMHYYAQAPAIAGGGMDKAYAEAAIVRAQDPFRGAMVVGGLHQQEKKWAQAEAEFREALRLSPGNSDAEFALAQVFALSGRYDEAFAMFEDLLQANPQNYAALYQIGRVAAISGQRLDRGGTALREYLASPVRATGLPSHAHAWNRLGTILARKGDIDGASDAYRKALELDPKLKDAEEALGKLK